MSKKKKEEPRMYTISEVIYVSFQVVATSEEDAQDYYRNLPVDKWKELVADCASNNYCDDEVVDDEEYTEEEYGDEEFYPKTEKAKKAIFDNSPEE